MNINDVSIGQARELLTLFGHIPQDDSHWEIGKNYIIRTVTHIDIGQLVKITPTEFVLVNASWIADTGRFAECVKEGTLSEVEPFPDGIKVPVGRGGYIDGCEWIHPLPRTQK